MKKSLIIVLAAAVLLLSACAVGPFTETMYAPEEPTAEPLPTPAPEFVVNDYYSAEEMEHSLQLVEYYDDYAGFQIFLPPDWHWEIVEPAEEMPEFGLDFWPPGSGDGRLRLRAYDGMFGVCGTGLVEVEGELSGTGKLRVGYYDGAEYPSFVGFYDSPAGWALTNDMGGTWSSHEAELEKILSSLVLDPGIIRMSKAESIADDFVAGRYRYDYFRTYFTRETGEISLTSCRMGAGGGEIEYICIDKDGELAFTCVSCSSEVAE